MNPERLFLDTAYIQAILNKRDQYHELAKELLPRVQDAHEVWLTEAILLEVGNALSTFNREAAARFIEQCYHTPNMQVVSLDTDLLLQGLERFRSRSDKTWSLTDCISFLVMEEQGISDAVTTDSHFIQAGFRALMLESIR